MGLSYVCSTELVIEKRDENPETPTSRGFPSNRLRQDGRVLPQQPVSPTCAHSNCHRLPRREEMAASADFLHFSEMGQ